MDLYSNIFNRHGKPLGFWIVWGITFSLSVYIVLNRNRLQWVPQHSTVTSMCNFYLLQNHWTCGISPLTARTTLCSCTEVDSCSGKEQRTI